jgi:4-hydroxy-2-oxoheptanedioate aldolase
MRQNHTLAQIRAGEPAIGLWLQSHSHHTARIIAAQGLFDWLVVDLEHTPVDVHTAATTLGAIADVSGGKCTPLVRVAQGTMHNIKYALDFGAQGVIVPMVNTAEDAQQVVRYARYPPDGDRGGGGLLPHLSYGVAKHVEFLPHGNRETLVAVQIETRQAVENIEAIADVPGIDLVFVGPMDLHLSLGLPATLWSDSPVFLSALGRVVDACQSRGIPLGTLAPNAELAKARLADGFTFVGMGSDYGHLLAALHAQVQQLKS